MANVLIAIPDDVLADLIGLNLRNSGFTTDFAQSARAATAVCAEVLPNLVVLDAELVDQSGLGLLRRWRADARLRSLAVIMLSASFEEANKVSALDAGADDYLTKPISSRELLARIRAVLRRKAPHALDSSVEIAGLNLNPATRCVALAGREIKLSNSEFRLLHFLMTHTDRVHSRGYLLDKVWGDHVIVGERIVDTHVKRLRQALSEVQCSHLIETVRGCGYRMTAARVGH